LDDAVFDDDELDDAADDACAPDDEDAAALDDVDAALDALLDPLDDDDVPDAAMMICRSAAANAPSGSSKRTRSVHVPADSVAGSIVASIPSVDAVIAASVITVVPLSTSTCAGGNGVSVPLMSTPCTLPVTAIGAVTTASFCGAVMSTESRRPS